MTKIIVLGPPAVGKSSLVRRAREQGLRALDLDEEIERRAGRHPSELIRDSGENEFRDEEHRALIEVLGTDFNVLGVGGGTFCFERNREVINAAGCSVYLRRDEEELAKRIFADELRRAEAGLGIQRPVLVRSKSSSGDAVQKLDLETIRSSLKKLLAERAAHYEKANLSLICTGKDESEIITEILKLVARRNAECL